jgi:hypothetical protein
VGSLVSHVDNKFERLQILQFAAMRLRAEKKPETDPNIITMPTRFIYSIRSPSSRTSAGFISFYACPSIDPFPSSTTFSAYSERTAPHASIESTSRLSNIHYIH